MDMLHIIRLVVRFHFMETMNAVSLYGLSRKVSVVCCWSNHNVNMNIFPNRTVALFILDYSINYFSVNRLILLFISCRGVMKNAHSDILFCLESD